MKFLADESFDSPIIEGLRQAGYEIESVAELSPGLPDDRLLDLAKEGNAILLTADRDFGELVFRQRRVTSGVVLIRLAGLSISEKKAIGLRILQAHEDQLSGAFTVISPAGVRIRQP